MTLGTSTDTPSTTELAVALHRACLSVLVGLCLPPDKLPLVVHHVAHHVPSCLDRHVPPGPHHIGLLLHQLPGLPTTHSTPPSRSSCFGPPCPLSRPSSSSTTSSTPKPVSRSRYSGYWDLHEVSVCQMTHRLGHPNLLTFV